MRVDPVGLLEALDITVRKKILQVPHFHNIISIPVIKY